MKHNDNNNDPLSDSAGDPRLTAYALGEMDASERAAFEAEIRDNPAAQAAIAEITALSGELKTALSAEPLPATAEAEDWRAAREAEARAARKRARANKPFRFPYFLVAGLATACFTLVFFTIVKPDYEKKELQKKQAALSAAAATGTITIDGTAYVALPTQPNTSATLPETPPAATITTPSAVAIVSGSSQIDLSKLAPTLVTNTPGQTNTGLSGLSLLEGRANRTLPTILDESGNEVVLMEKYTVNANINRPSHMASSAQIVAGSSLAGQNSQVTFGDVSVPIINGGAAIQNGGWSNSIIGANNVTGGSYQFSARAHLSHAAFNWGSQNTESYAAHTENTFQRVAENPLSTFSADIDTASYTNIRRFLNRGQLPPRDAVRIEEMVNYFSYNYAPPAKDGAAPFSATMEVAAAPWNPEHRLVRIGIKGREIDTGTRPPANLVFLIDVSGSMDEPNKLPLAKESMRMLVNRLRPDDRIAIVTYANTIDLALASTPVGEKGKILDALDALRAAGGTNGGKGIQLAYEIAKANFLKDGANRVILCTDGDFNIGITNRDELTSLIEEKAKSGVFLTVLGFGMGNLKDSTLQLLANKGNGNHGYIDNRDEARRLLVEQTAGTLVTIAKDVKLQVEFNPAQAESYRLIGYEKRLLAKEDFNNDKVDAGEIGAGHTVTALYEVTPAKPAGSSGSGSAESRPAATVDPLKYQSQTVVTTTPKLELKGELLTLKIRYKAPSAEMSDKVEFVLEDKGADFAEASPDFKFTCSIAAFGMILRDSANKGLASYDRVLEWAEAGMAGATDAELNRRSEFTDLVRRARQIAN